MFKKSKIAAATVALLSAAAVQNASAVAIDTTGTKAQVLVFPYYNTNGAFATAFNIRNTTAATKAVKLRFRESKYSNDVLDFNLYLSPFDRFSVGVNPSDSATGKQARLFVNDTSCTHPAIPAEGVALKGNVYKQTKDSDAREGYLEVIEMGEVDPSAFVDPLVTSGASARKIVDGIKHTDKSVPKDCTVIADAWAKGGFTRGGASAVVGGVVTPNTTSPLTVPATLAGGVDHATILPKGITKPTGGLQGWSFLLDFDYGNAFVAMPAAIRNYQTGWGQHYRSADQEAFLLPSLASGNDFSSYVVNNSGTAITKTDWAKTGDYAQSTAGYFELFLSSGIAGPSSSGYNPLPVAHVISAVGLTNDYIVPAKTNTGTDWVISFPFRKHGLYSGVFYDTTTKDISGSASSVKIGSAPFFNKEEQIVTPTVDDGFSPVLIVSSAPETLPREVNILTFAKKGNKNPIGVLGTVFTKPYGVDYDEGFGTITYDTSNGSADPVAKIITNDFIAKAKGVPSIGFAAFRGEYDPAIGKSTNVGESVPHTFIYDRP